MTEDASLVLRMAYSRAEAWRVLGRFYSEQELTELCGGCDADGWREFMTVEAGMMTARCRHATAFADLLKAQRRAAA